MKSMTVLRFVNCFSRSFKGMGGSSTAVISSCSRKVPPSSFISLRISRPPTSSPLAYNCGYVGQLECFLRPCRTSSSDKISKLPKGIFSSSKSSTACRENPHLDAEGFPFINNITSEDPINRSKRFVSNSFSVLFSSAFSSLLAVAAVVLLAGVRVCNRMTARVTSAESSTPSNVSTTVPASSNMINVGTIVTLYCLERVGTDSASTRAKRTS
mmetsp:Transcript_20529/g.44451  ORF Transcript_20529/g.44451 Transcript_20529/m.44451 type:complete len:213 (-) Transcript_20529:229-867(-)